MVKYLLICLCLLTCPLAAQELFTIPYKATPVPMLIVQDTMTAVYVKDWSDPRWHFYSQPNMYRRWWKEIAACAGIVLVGWEQEQDVKFYLISANAFTTVPLRPGELGIIGLTDVSNSHIYLIESGRMDSHLVKHEMLHWLLWKDHRPFAHNTSADSVFVHCDVDYGKVGH